MTVEPVDRVEPGGLVGAVVEVEVGPVAHGGHCVARHEGQVVFVRHALPGERVRALITEGAEGARFLRAEAVEVLVASPDRVEPRCPHARPGGCGGCDFQHVTLAAQRRLKAAVVVEQLHRLAKVDVEVEVEAVPGDEDGLGWRTRTRLAVDAEGRAGLRRHRSHDVVALGACPIAHPLVNDSGIFDRTWPGITELQVAVSVTSGEQILLADGTPSGRARLTERAAGRDWRVSGAGFWQVHPGAAEVLVEAVRSALEPRAGEHLLDLYAGVGLFAGALAKDLGPEGRIDAVESDESALRDARRNLHDRATVRLSHGRVDGWLRTSSPQSCDLVVLDPPRSGGGKGVVELLARRRPRAIAYVACDPAALARDVGTFMGLGYELTGLRAFDLFPMTHHVECVAVLRPRAESS